MTGKKTTYQLFHPSGCLTAEAMQLYSERALSQEDLIRVENHLASCELCRDALEGFELMGDPREFDETVTGIREKLLELEKHGKSRTLRFSEKWIYFGAAATVVILIGLFYFLSGKLNLTNQNQLAQEININKYDIPPMPKAANQVVHDEIPSVTEVKQEPTGLDNFRNEDSGKGNGKITSAAEKPANEKEASSRGKISPMKIRNSEKSKKESLLVEELLKDEDKDDLTSTASSPDLASNQPVEYFLGEVVIYDESPDALSEDLFENSVSGAVAGQNQKQGFAAPVSKKSTTIEKSAVNSPASDQLKSESKSKSTGSKEHFFTMVDRMPEFPGGKEALIGYLSQHLKYPSEAKKENIQGTVLISFIVGEDGHISQTEIVRGIGGGCDEEAKAVVSSMPSWQSALKDGEPTRVKFTLPVVFRMR